VKIVLRGGSEVTALLLGVVSTLWVSRTVGPTYFGYYAVTVTIVTLGSAVINAGLSTAGSQRVANAPTRVGEVAWIVTVSRGLIAVVAVLGGLVVLVAAPIEPVLRDYLRVGLIVWALLPFRSEWVLVAQGRLGAISAVRVAGSVATVLAAILLVRDASDADRIAWIPVVGAVVSAAGSSFVVHRSSPFRRPAGIPIAATIRAYLSDGLHYLKSDVSMFIFTSSDRLFLYAFATPAVVGLYAAAYNVIQPFYMISAVIGDAMYLPLAQAFGTDRLSPTFRRYVDLMCFATVPLGFFLLAFAPTVISILYGTKYAGASEYLAILGWVITFGYTSGIAVIPFSAWNRPREYGNSTAFGGAVNLGLNFALIPSFEGFGAAWATVAAKVAVTLAGIRYFRRATDYPLVRDFAEYLAVSGAAFAAAVPATWVLPYPAASGIVVFGLVYIALVAVVRWRHYGPLSPGTLRSLLPGGSGVNKGGGS
jgi:O-antigen/teichoic acid export membrane protein